MTISQETKHRLYLATAILSILAVFTGGLAGSQSEANAAVSPAQQVAQQQAQQALTGGFTCTRTDKSNGGFILNCDPVTSPPSPSPSTSPSASPTPTTSVSPSPSVTTTSTTPPVTTPPAPPTTSPPAPGTRLTNCFDKLILCGYPHLGNTGVPAGTVLTPSGSLTIRTGGTWTNLEVKGCIDVQTTQPVILRNIRITPDNAGEGCGQGNIGKHNAGSLLIEHVTSYCTQARGHGFWIANTIARFVQTYGCENGFELNGNSTVEDSWIASSEVGGNDPHGDDIQSQDGNDVLVRHNTFAGLNPITSSIITNPTLNNRWTIVDNFLSAGAYTLYCSEEGSGWKVVNNRFYPAKTGNRHSAAYGLTDACNTPSRIQWTGNYRDNDLSVVNANA